MVVAVSKRVRRAVPAVVLFAIAAGCSNGGGGDRGDGASSQSSVTTPRRVTTTTIAKGPATTSGGATSAVVTNKWLPLTPGLQTVKLGTLNRGHRELEHRRVYTITNVTKMVDGRRAILVLDQDFDGGELAEQAVDYVAINEKGDVLLVGSYTESYEGGQFVNAEDAWLAGVKGAVQGMLMPTAPRAGTDGFVVTAIPGGERTTAAVFKTGASVCVPFTCYHDVVILKEGNEWKYHAPGVGEVKLEPHYSGGEQEIEQLINVIELSKKSLAEINAEVLRLDVHARDTAPDVFGASQPAEQAR